MHRRQRRLPSSAHDGERPVALVTNIPAPYRVPVYENLNILLGGRLRVIYLAPRENDRQWSIPNTTVDSTYLPPRVLKWHGRYIHFTSGVWETLVAIRPRTVITTGFNPPHLAAIFYCVLTRSRHVGQTDGSEFSEQRLHSVHRLLRRFTARVSAAFVTASDSGARLVSAWGAEPTAIFKSPLAVDNDLFAAAEAPDRDIDVLFVGRLAPVKQPHFVLDVANAAALTLRRRLKVCFVGSGPELARLQEQALAHSSTLDVRFAGFQERANLAGYYGRSKVMLFPTRWDPWGVVANEASAAGAVTITCPSAGAAGELIIDRVTGRVLKTDLGAWSAALRELLENADLRSELAFNARAKVAEFTTQEAALGLYRAIEHAERF